jgi:hypothetical protein
LKSLSFSYGLERRNHFQKFGRRRRFVPQSERLTTKIVAESAIGINISRTGRAVTDQAGPSTANKPQVLQFGRVRRGLISSAVAISIARPLCRNQPLMLAGSGGWEEDRALLKK